MNIIRNIEISEKIMLMIYDEIKSFVVSILPPPVAVLA